MKKISEKSFVWLSFLSSFSTLFCCTLPILFSLIGASATFSSLVSYFPGGEVLLAYKFALFCFSATMLLVTNIITRLPISACPIDPVLREKCGQFRKMNKKLLLVSIFIWLVSFYFAYLAFPLQLWMEL